MSVKDFQDHCEVGGSPQTIRDKMVALCNEARIISTTAYSNATEWKFICPIPQFTCLKNRTHGAGKGNPLFIPKEIPAAEVTICVFHLIVKPEDEILKALEQEESSSNSNNQRKGTVIV